MSDARSTPLYCPYCGEENLFPNEASHGAWECHSCARVFTVKFNGLLAASLPLTSGKASEKGVSR
jgi:transposase-like protein